MASLEELRHEEIAVVHWACGGGKTQVRNGLPGGVAVRCPLVEIHAGYVCCCCLKQRENELSVLKIGGRMSVGIDVRRVDNQRSRERSRRRCLFRLHLDTE